MTGTTNLAKQHYNMGNIRAIVFDLGGVLMQENDYPLSKTEQLLEQQFGKINTNEAYYAWATKTTHLSEKEIKDITEDIITNIYDMRDYAIFEHLPNIKLAIASNHLSAINKRIDNMEIRSKFCCILISADIEIEKSNEKFYERLLIELQEQPENILFVDDDIKNIAIAKNKWFVTLHYDHSKNITEEVVKHI